MRSVVALSVLFLAESAFAAAGTPRPVSPGARSSGAVAELRCPTFSWSGVENARGYELAIFRVAQAPGAEPVLVTRATVSGDARSWTPALGQCLERGERYAWSVAAAGKGSGGDAGLDWAPAMLFEVAAVPSADELEQAVATIQRHLAERGERPRETGAPTPHSFLPGPLASPTLAGRTVSASSTPAPGSASLTVGGQIHLGVASDLFKGGAVFLWDAADGNTALGRNALASASGYASHNTALGFEALRYTTGSNEDESVGSYNTAVGHGALRYNTTASLNTATGAVALGSNTTGYGNTADGAYALFNNATGSRNTATGAAALLSNSTGEGNTAIGASALRYNTGGYWNTATGIEALRSNLGGYRNTATGAFALKSNGSGVSNTATGYGSLQNNLDGGLNAATGIQALTANTTGDRNTAIGAFALGQNLEGNRNVAVGYGAGLLTKGNSNILVNNYGTENDQNVLRIGAGDGTSNGQLNRAFIHGIRNRTTGEADAIAVLIDSEGQLGTMSSSRTLKQDIRDLGEIADRLLALRPVAFRYKQHVAADPDTPLQFGLVAEEVAEVLPELVVFDEDGKPETVKYHLLSSLLLRELQKQQAVLERQQTENQRQQADLQRQQAELRLLHARLDSIEKTVREPSRRDGDLGSRR